MFQACLIWTVYQQVPAATRPFNHSTESNRSSCLQDFGFEANVCNDILVWLFLVYFSYQQIQLIDSPKMPL